MARRRAEMEEQKRREAEEEEKKARTAKEIAEETKRKDEEMRQFNKTKKIKFTKIK